MPHKIKNLWPQIADYDSLFLAWKEVKRGKGSSPLILKFESNLAVNLGKILNSLNDNSYRPRRHYEFWIHDPKPRLIQAPCLEDRIVQHAVCNALRLPIQRRLISDTYCCLIGRGTHRCSEKLSSFLINKKWKFALKLDIQKFFYSIDHQCLIEELQRIIGCKKTLDLLIMFIRTNENNCGIPIGASTSQILANVALNPLDHYVKRELKISTYLRYCDDMICLFETAEAANKVLTNIKNKIKDFKLILNQKSGIHYIPDGIDWVGYRHWRTKKLIRKRALKKLRRKAMNCNLETAMSYLSHSKRTSSLSYVANFLTHKSPHNKSKILIWIDEHAPKVQLQF